MIPRSVSYEQLALDRLKLAARQRITMEALHDTVVPHAILDYACMTLTLGLEAYVHELVNEDRTYTLEERPVPETWKDHLLMSLPEHSFRRRFLELFWDRPDGPRVVRRSHEVRVRQAVAFPHGHFPKSFGAPLMYTRLDPGTAPT